MTAITQPEIDQQVFSLYDEYCHGRIDRRDFLKRAGALGALAFAISLLPAARLPQQLDTALQRAGGEARMGAHRGILQAKPGLRFSLHVTVTNLCAARPAGPSCALG